MASIFDLSMFLQTLLLVLDERSLYSQVSKCLSTDPATFLSHIDHVIFSPEPTYSLLRQAVRAEKETPSSWIIFAFVQLKDIALFAAPDYTMSLDWRSTTCRGSKREAIGIPKHFDGLFGGRWVTG